MTCERCNDTGRIKLSPGSMLCWCDAGNARALAGYQARLDSDDAYREFVEAYIECMIWSSPEDDEGNRPDESDFGFDELDVSERVSVYRDCASFLDSYRRDIGTEYAQAGHDFSLTRNGHGAGFWGGDWPYEAGQRLTEACEPYGGQYVMTWSEGIQLCS